MAENKLSLEPFDHEDGAQVRLARDIAGTAPRDLTHADVLILKGGTPAELRAIFELTPDANRDLRLVIGGLAAAGAYEATMHKPPLIDVATAYDKLAAEAYAH